MEHAPSRSEHLFSAADYLDAHKAPQNEGCRIVITGKGGVGKTTTTALLANIFAEKNHNVLAVDEDPQQNLAFSLGFPLDQAENLVPVSRNLEYIEEKTGARPGQGWGAMLRINPDVSDVVSRFGMRIAEKINLLVIGSVIQAATGCLCPENALLDSIVRYIRLRNGEIILMDTQAGVEHFGRALADGFQHAIIMTEPGFNAVQVALHSARLAKDLEIPDIHLVVNRCRSEADKAKVQGYLRENPFSSITHLPFDETVMTMEPDVSKLKDVDTPYVAGVRKLADMILHNG